MNVKPRSTGLEGRRSFHDLEGTRQEALGFSRGKKVAPSSMDNDATARNFHIVSRRAAGHSLS